MPCDCSFDRQVRETVSAFGCVDTRAERQPLRPLGLAAVRATVSAGRTQFG